MNNLAKIRNRISGAIIDYGLILTLTIAYTIAFGELNEDGGQTVEGTKALPIFLLWFLYFPGIEGLTGQTLGKKIVGIRVVKLNGTEVTMKASLIRHLFDMIDLNFGGLVAILVIKNSEKKQRVGDLVAKTIVVEDKLEICENCKTELSLDQQELMIGQFVCPRCKHQNSVNTR